MRVEGCVEWSGVEWSGVLVVVVLVRNTGGGGGGGGGGVCLCSKTDTKTNAERKNKKGNKESQEREQKKCRVLFFSSSCGLLRAVCWIWGVCLLGSCSWGGGEGRGGKGREGEGRGGGGKGREGRGREEKRPSRKRKKKKKRRGWYTICKSNRLDTVSYVITETGRKTSSGYPEKKRKKQRLVYSTQKQSFKHLTVQYSTVHFNGNEEKAFFYTTIANHIHIPKKTN